MQVKLTVQSIARHLELVLQKDQCHFSASGSNLSGLDGCLQHILLSLLTIDISKETMSISWKKICLKKRKKNLRAICWAFIITLGRRKEIGRTLPVNKMLFTPLLKSTHVWPSYQPCACSLEVCWNLAASFLWRHGLHNTRSGPRLLNGRGTFFFLFPQKVPYLTPLHWLSTSKVSQGANYQRA